MADKIELSGDLEAATPAPGQTATQLNADGTPPIPAAPPELDFVAAALSKDRERLAAMRKRFPADPEFVFDQFSKGHSVEQATVEMKRLLKRLAPGEIDPDDEGDLRARVAELLTPGEHPEDRPLPELVGVGKCDGVFFLGKGTKAVAINDDEVHVIEVLSLQRAALRYLRPMSKTWHALQSFGTNGARYTGTSRPNADFLISPQMHEVAAKAKRKIEWIFTMDDHCIDAVQPAHRSRFRVFKVEEGIWAVLYL